MGEHEQELVPEGEVEQVVTSEVDREEEREAEPTTPSLRELAQDKDKKGKKGKKEKAKGGEGEKSKKPEPTEAEAMAQLIKANRLGSATAFLVMIAKDPGPLIAAMTDSKWKKLVSKNATDHKTLAKLFAMTPDDQVIKLQIVFAARYNVKVGQVLDDDEEGMDWDAPGLRRCWEILEKLPPEHVKLNKSLKHWTRYKDEGSSGSGYYAERTGESALGYDKDNIDDLNYAADAGDTLYEVTRFNKVVRHEVGHAVDKKIGGSQAYCINNAAGGDWTEIGRMSRGVVDQLISTASAGISKVTDEDTKKAIADLVAAAMNGGGDTLEADIKQLPAFKGKKPKLPRATRDEVLDDPVVKTALNCGPGKNPWYNHPNMGENIGGKHYQAGYGSSWVSYSKAALAKKVSTYQFRHPGEWFAEAYAAYFEPDGKGKVGTLLDARDSTTKTWFDNNVLPKEKKSKKKSK